MCWDVPIGSYCTKPVSQGQQSVRWIHAHLLQCFRVCTHLGSVNHRELSQRESPPITSAREGDVALQAPRSPAMKHQIK